MTNNHSKTGKRKTRDRKPRPTKSLPTPETKHYCTGLNLTAQDTAPSGTNPALFHVQTLNNISDGSGQSERSGLKIQARRIRVRIKLAVDPNSTSTFANLVADAHVFRVVLYLDRSINGVAPGWTNLFDDIPNNGAQEYSYQNVWYKNRFQLLVDKHVTVGPSFVVFDGATYHALGNNQFVEFDIPLNHSTWYSDGTNNLTGIQRNNIGMFIASDASTTAYPQMKFSYRSQLLYYDY